MTQDPSEIPEIEFNLTMESVTVAPRAIQATWSMSAAQDLRDLWGPRKRRITPLKRLIDVLDDPTYDPDNPPENEFEIDDGCAESDLVTAMAKEMSDEIDREILKKLQAAGGCNSPAETHAHDPERPPPFDIVLKVETTKAVELAAKGIIYDLHDRVMQRVRPREPEDLVTAADANPTILYHSSCTMP